MPEHQELGGSAGDQLGMTRFFSADNLNRYRILARSEGNPDERRKILCALAGEMKALRAELRSALREANGAGGNAEAAHKL